MWLCLVPINFIYQRRQGSGFGCMFWLCTSGLVVVQLLSRVWFFVTPWPAAHQASLSFTVFQSLLKFLFIVSVILSNHLIFCFPLLLCLQSFTASGSFPMILFFTSGGQSIVASASASVLPMNIQCWFPFRLIDLILQSSESESHFVVSSSLQLHERYSPWNSPGQNTVVGNHSLLQGIFPTQGSNPGPTHCRWTLYQRSHQGSPKC